MRACFFGLAAATFVLVAGGPAAGHGRFPTQNAVLVDENDDQRILSRATYGYLISDNGGAEWRWICPEAVGFDADKEDPATVISGDGTIVSATFDGLVVAHDKCDWNRVGGDLDMRFFVDLGLRKDRNRIVAMSSNGLAADTFDVNLWSSDDNAKTWAKLGTQPPSDFLGVAMELSHTDDKRVYISGRDGMSGTPATYQGVLLRSDNSGESWTRYEVPGADGVDVLPYVVSVDPNDADRVYIANVRREGTSVTYFGLVVTKDAGESFEIVFERDHGVQGFALSPDGKTVALGSQKSGLSLASASDLQFAKVSDLHFGCLHWTAGALYACTDQFIDGFALGRSVDGGKTFEGIMNLNSPCGPPECAADSTVGFECPGRWPDEAGDLTAPLTCEAPEIVANDGCECRATLPNTRTNWWSVLVLAGLLRWRRRSRS